MKDENLKQKEYNKLNKIYRFLYVFFKPKYIIGLNIFIIIISILGMLLSSYLWYEHMNINKDVAFCYTGGCNKVKQSKYSVMFEVPIATYGFIFYFLMFLFSFLRFYIKNGMLNFFIWFSIFTGLVFTIYLRYIELTKIHAICMWCWSSVILIIWLLAIMGLEIKEETKSKQI